MNNDPSDPAQEQLILLNTRTLIERHSDVDLDPEYVADVNAQILELETMIKLGSNL